MTVLDNDMIRLEHDDGETFTVKLSDMFFEPTWPPAEQIQIFGYTWKRVSFSSLTHEQANHPNLARGALYRVDHGALTAEEAAGIQNDIH